MFDPLTIQVSKATQYGETTVTLKLDTSVYTKTASEGWIYVKHEIERILEQMMEAEGDRPPP